VCLPKAYYTQELKKVKRNCDGQGKNRISLRYRLALVGDKPNIFNACFSDLVNCKEREQIRKKKAETRSMVTRSLPADEVDLFAQRRDYGV
jgi:ABC-type phosphate transport system ATPase subunit